MHSDPPVGESWCPSSDPTWTLRPTAVGALTSAPTTHHINPAEDQTGAPSSEPTWTLKPTAVVDETRYPTIYHDKPADGVTRVPSTAPIWTRRPTVDGDTPHPTEERVKPPHGESWAPSQDPSNAPSGITYICL
jgi:hypothetical protein